MANWMEGLEARRLLAGVTGVVLIDARTDQPVPGFQFTDGAVVDLAKLGRQLNIRADVDPAGGAAAGSVRFNYDGNPTYKIDNVAPYSIGTNNGNDFLPWTPTLGTHALVATAYPSANGIGTRGASISVNFQVVDTSPLPTNVIRINAGGGAFTTTSRTSFAADSGFTGGVKQTSVFPVANTLDDPLYQSYRYGKTFSFAKPAANGVYTLKLYFVEPTTYTRIGQRKFDVRAEGNLILDDLDLVKSAGNQKALTKSFNVTISDGQLNLAFAGSVGNAIVSAIELVPQPRTIAVPAPVRVNAGGGTLTDSFGRPFEADAGYFAGGSAVATPFDVLNAVTADDALLGTYRHGASFTFAKPIANGNYDLWIEFADPTSAAAGARLFDVTAEGKLVLDNFDIFTAAGGANLAVAKKFHIKITDAALNLGFTAVAGDAIVSAVVAIPTDIPAAMIPYSGIGDYATSPQHEAIRTAWSVRSQSNLRQIGEDLLLYQNEHRGKFPPDLKALVEDEDADFEAFANPRIPTLLPRGELSLIEKSAWVAAQTDYVYVTTFANTFPRNVEWDKTIIAYENPSTTPADTLNALYLDGHVNAVPRSQIVAQFGGTPAAPPEPARPLQTAGDSRIIASQQNLRTLSDALLSYSNNNKARMPLQLGLLFPFYNVTAATFINPRTTTAPPAAGSSDDDIRAWINAATDYTYLGAGRLSYKTPVIAYETPAEMSLGMNLLFKDGHVEFREMRWALETIASAKAQIAALP